MVILGFLLFSFVVGSFVFLIKSEKLIIICPLAVILFQTAVSIYALFHLGTEDSVYFRFDALGTIFSLVLSVLLFTSFFHTGYYFRRNKSTIRERSIYSMSFIFFAAAMSCAYFGDHLGILWACIEATTLGVTALIYHERTSSSLEATWKYLFVSSIGITIAFTGILLVTMAAHEQGVTEPHLNQLIEIAPKMNPAWLSVAFLLILTGFSAKIGLFPLHAAAIDAKTTAPYHMNGLISTALVNTGFIGVLRIFSILSGTESFLFSKKVLLLAGIISIAVAAFHLLKVKQFKRMYAFSTLEHMGIVCLALASGGAGIFAAILHLVLHSFSKASLFYQSGQVYSVYGSYIVDDTGNYIKLHPVGAIAMLLSLFTIVAIPPSGLFVTEFMIFRSLFQAHFYVTFVIALILLTVIIYALSASMLHLLYSPSNNTKPVYEVKRFETSTQFLLIGLVFYLAVSPPVFLTDLIKSASFVMGGTSW